MNIFQLLNLLDFRPNHKVIKTSLPHVPRIQSFLPKRTLWPVFSPAEISKYAPREALLQHLHDGGWSSSIWLADQQMDVLGHNHVSDYDETVAKTRLFKNLQEKTPPSWSAE